VADVQGLRHAPPDILSHLGHVVNSTDNPRSISTYPSVESLTVDPSNPVRHDRKPCRATQQMLTIASLLQSLPDKPMNRERFIEVLFDQEIKGPDMETIPFPILAIILERIRMCKHDPPLTCSKSVYEHMGREDVSETLGNKPSLRSAERPTVRLLV
jgi:hypothetical protein